MASFSYNKSIAITEILNRIDALRTDILITPVSPLDQLQLRWECTLQRIRYSELISGRSFTSRAIAVALSPFGRKKPKLNERQIIAYKQAFDYIQQNWLVSHKHVTYEHISHIYNILGYPEIIPQAEELQRTLEYLQANEDHPIIQSSIAHLVIRQMYEDTGELATLVSYLFLYKDGYNVDGYITLEDYFFQTKNMYDKTIRNIARSSKANEFIEYISIGIEKNLLSIMAKIKEPKTIHNPLVPDVDLNQRQKEILSLIDMPDVQITNRDIQKKFKVSQITASRDLAKLNVLGLIFSRGKGRSVYYTKV